MSRIYDVKMKKIYVCKNFLVRIGVEMFIIDFVISFGEICGVKDILKFNVGKNMLLVIILILILWIWWVKF